MLCELLLYNEVNPLYVYMYLLPLGPLSCPPPPHPSRSPQNTKLSSLWYTVASHEPPASHVAVHIHQLQSPNSSPHLVSTCLFPPSASLFRSSCIFATYMVCTLPGPWRDGPQKTWVGMVRVKEGWEKKRNRKSKEKLDSLAIPNSSLFLFCNLGISETTSSGLWLCFYKVAMMTQLIKILRNCSSSQKNCWSCKKNLS